MLQIENIKKQYVTGDLTQTALNGVSVNLRDNEFVAILGPSGSGKTTMLNMIGGLDRYDSGDLIINGISTKKYKDKDWDSYRNHTIGFVFQSYNLIPHQSVLSNVELALTISGVSRSERRKRAKKALEQVGLGEQIHKKPNQMSGGQMQRVAIARALINDPDILLADEPTGALDSETSVQVMELLKEVAQDRLVVMVTHNPELAEQYATRIVKLRDGVIMSDSNPYEPDQDSVQAPEHRNMGKSSMSRLTALTLSFNNLRTKKGRTFLTSFAGSIGIIGIALILSLSTGVNDYIQNIQKSTMTSYPIAIEEQAFDLSSMMETGHEAAQQNDKEHDKDAVYSNGMDLQMASSMTSNFTENNLTDFKKYLDKKDSKIHDYVGENGIVYSYNTKYEVFSYDQAGELVNADGTTFATKDDHEMASMISSGNQNAMMSMGMSTQSSVPFEQMMKGTDGQAVSPVITDNYDVLYGSWPSSQNEVVLVLNEQNEVSASVLYALGLLPYAEYDEMMEKIDSGEEFTADTEKISYEEICQHSFYLIPACDEYEEQENGTFKSVADDETKMKSLLENNAVELKVTAVVRPKEDADTLLLNKEVGYTQDLTDYLIEHTNESTIVKAQAADPQINVLNGIRFDPADDAAKAADAKTYLLGLGVSEKASICRQMLQDSGSGEGAAVSAMAAMDETQLAASLDAFLQQPDDQVLVMIYDRYVSSGNYDDNMKNFGVVSLDAPSSINIYADSFEDKDAIGECITDYNKGKTKENQIIYTDYVGLLMSSVTTIINVISYVLIAFVSVSLVVSSIMIGIITYISVLERTKEIGILRAMGASKRNISQVFNAETFIIGLFAGLIGIGITLLLLIPMNAIIHAVADSADVNAALPVRGAIILVILSMILTLIGGLIPSKKAARKDPVTALRTE